MLSGLGCHLAGGFGCVLGAGLRGCAAAGGEQSSQGVPGVDCTPAAHGPGGGAGVLGLLIFLDTESAGEARLPPHLVCSWPEAVSPAQLRQRQTCCVTLCDVLSLSGPEL